MARVIGTFLNAAAVLVGGTTALVTHRRLPARTQSTLKGLMAALVVVVGFLQIWRSVGGGALTVARQLALAFLALMAGALLGRALGLQRQVSRLGEFAQRTFTRAAEGKRPGWNEAFTVCTIVFCFNPMGVLGVVQDGVSNDFRLLTLKAALDGLAAMSFVAVLGAGALAAVIPVLAWQGTLTLGVRWLALQWPDPALWNAVGACGGLLTVCLCLVVLEVRRVPLMDYLPSLLVAPALDWLWRKLLL